MASKVTDAARALLEDSLAERAREMRLAAERCAGAYRQPGPLRRSSERLARVYGEAAELFERELAAAKADADEDAFERLPGGPKNPEGALG